MKNEEILIHDTNTIKSKNSLLNTRSLAIKYTQNMITRLECTEQGLTKSAITSKYE